MSCMWEDDHISGLTEQANAFDISVGETAGKNA